MTKKDERNFEKEKDLLFFTNYFLFHPFFVVLFVLNDEKGEKFSPSRCLLVVDETVDYNYKNGGNIEEEKIHRKMHSRDKRLKKQTKNKVSKLNRVNKDIYLPQRS